MDKTLDERCVEVCKIYDEHGLFPYHVSSQQLCQLIRDMQERIKELEFELDESQVDIEICQNTDRANKFEIEELKKENARLRDAIMKTLNDNLHLADGDNCTLIELKKVCPLIDDE